MKNISSYNELKFRDEYKELIPLLDIISSYNLYIKNIYFINNNLTLSFLDYDRPTSPNHEMLNELYNNNLIYSVISSSFNMNKLNEGTSTYIIQLLIKNGIYKFFNYSKRKHEGKIIEFINKTNPKNFNEFMKYLTISIKDLEIYSKLTKDDSYTHYKDIFLKSLFRLNKIKEVKEINNKTLFINTLYEECFTSRMKDYLKYKISGYITENEKQKLIYKTEDINNFSNMHLSLEFVKYINNIRTMKWISNLLNDESFNDKNKKYV